MRTPNPFQFLLLLFALLLLVALVQVGIFTVALDKLGLAPHSALLLLFASLMGSGINLPLFTMDSEPRLPEEEFAIPRLLFSPRIPHPGKTIVAVNVGGALIPICLSVYLIIVNDILLWEVTLAIIIVSTISYLFSRPIRGLGIGMPIFVAPFSAALTALLLSQQHSAPLAYICGTLGVLIGADLLRLKDIRKLAAPVAAIGGAGTFDGIFFTGIVAVLLA